MPKIDLPDDELQAVIAALRGLIRDDKYPHAPRLDALKAALARLEAGANAPPPAKADKRAKGSKVTAAKASAKSSPGFKLGRLTPDR